MRHVESAGGWAESSIDLLWDDAERCSPCDAFYRAAVRHAQLDDRPAPLPPAVPASRSPGEVCALVADLLSRAPALEDVSEGAVYREQWNEVVWRSGWPRGRIFA